MLDGQQSAMLGFASVTLLKVVHDVAKPFTGYQYVEAGGEHLDKSLAILNGPRGEIMDDNERQRFLLQGEKLVPIRQNLDIDTRTYTGSLIYWSEAQKFHKKAQDLHTITLSSSHKAEIERSLRQIDERTEAEQRRAWEQIERERDERQGRQIQEAAPQITLPNHPYSQAQASSQYSSSQEPAYPPAAYYERATNGTLACSSRR